MASQNSSPNILACKFAPQKRVMVMPHMFRLLRLELEKQCSMYGYVSSKATEAMEFVRCNAH